MQRHQFPRFSVAVPDRWTEQSTYVFVDDEAQGFKTTLVVTSERAYGGQSLGEYVADQARRMQQGLKQFEIREPAKSITVNGQVGVRMIIAWQGPAGEQIRQLQVYFKSRGRFYTLTCTQAADDFRSHLPRFEKIISSFRHSD